MGEVFSKLSEFSESYLDDKNEYRIASKKVPSWKMLVDDLPELLRNLFGLSDRYLVKGSIGQGNMTEIPWICFFDKEITRSAQAGYYLVILFRKDMKGFYLSLNQGWTQYEKAYNSRKIAFENLKLNVQAAQNGMNTLGGLDISNLDIGATRDLGKGYERGNIASRYFDFKDGFSDDDLNQGFKLLFSAFTELKGLVGENILNIRSMISEESFQDTLHDLQVEAYIPDAGPVKKKTSRSYVINKLDRDSRVSKAGLQRADYLCEIDPAHHTFTSEKSGRQYVEGHHLIPMECQDEFEFSLDVPENIVSLCPNCHRKIHLAPPVERGILIETLYSKRAGLLLERGFEIDLDHLKKLY